MRSLPTLLIASILPGCAVPEPTRSPGTASASMAAFTVDPRPEPTPLSPRAPTSRPNREVERMPSRELARWILPEHAGQITAAEIFPARWGVITYAYLWRAPDPVRALGVCQVDGWGVGFQVENERSLTPQQSVDPPLRPAWTVPERRYRVTGKVGPLSAASCASPTPYWRWSEAPSAEAIGRAAGLIEQAQKIAGGRSSGLRLSCTRMVTDDATGNSIDRPCDDPPAFLQRLTPDLIKRVRSSQCAGEISHASEGECVAVEYHDPAAPGSFSIYMVRITGGDTPKAVEIVQGMLPPQ